MDESITDRFRELSAAMPRRPHAVVFAHRLSLDGHDAALVLAPADVTQANSESYARFCRAHLQVDKVAVLKEEDGLRSVLYSEVPARSLEGLLHAASEFPPEVLYYSLGAEKDMPRWPEDV